MKKRTVAELTEVLERANERITRDVWFIRSLYPEPGWSVLVSPRAYQILLVRVTDDDGRGAQVDYFDTLAPNWPTVRAELSRYENDHGTTVSYDKLSAALSEVSRAHAAHKLANIPKNTEGSR
jgi:hypothetical protein